MKRLIHKALHRFGVCNNCGHGWLWHTPFGCVKCDGYDSSDCAEY